MPRHWTDQPAILETLPVLCHFYLKDHIVEVFKRSDTEWYFTAGNLFYSQTVKCPSAEKVFECIMLGGQSNKDKTSKVPEGCELLEAPPEKEAV